MLAGIKAEPTAIDHPYRYVCPHRKAIGTVIPDTSPSSWWAIGALLLVTAGTLSGLWIYFKGHCGYFDGVIQDTKRDIKDGKIVAAARTQNII